MSRHASDWTDPETPTYRSVDEMLAAARAGIPRLSPREAAASLVSLGIPAADVVGGMEAWAAAGLPVVPGVTAVEQVVR